MPIYKSMNFDISKFISDFFSKGHERSIKAKRNILGNVFVKVASTLVSLLIIPITINYINPTQYGIWLTLSSVIAWISLFDIGLGGGLRNRLTQALAEGNTVLAKAYVSTTYGVITLIIIFVSILFFIVNPFLNWASILNAPEAMRSDLSVVAGIVFITFSFQFVFKLITTILTAHQETFKTSLLNFFGSLIGFIIIFILTKTTEGSLLKLALALSTPPIFIFIIASVILFSGKYKSLRPSIKLIEIKYLRNLANLGLQFFFIQIAGIIVYSSTNILISQFFGPAEVTPYNVALRLFGATNMIFFIILTPYTPAYTEAYFKDDFNWIKKNIKGLIYIWIVLSIAIILVLPFSKAIFTIWLNNKVIVPLSLSVFIVFYMVFQSWNAIFTYFLNGTGKIRLQLYASFGEAISFIPLAWFFAIYCNMKILGIVLASIIPLAVGSIWTFIQYRKIINRSATGIWNK
jgi:O-antigen/teichoic acid export membrane protein